MSSAFPIDIAEFTPLPLDPGQPLRAEDRKTLETNIALCRDIIVFFTSLAEVKGVGGHSGGAYDTVPEVMIAHGFMLHGRGERGRRIVPVFFDEAGHRVATQYLMAALGGDLAPERLLHYREFEERLPGHPERGLTPGVQFSSGRLGHLWPFVNGVAMAEPEAVVLLLGSDGSQMEGNDAEAARLAVAQQLNVKLLIDDNDVTISGRPSEYLPGFDVGRTLGVHGLPVEVVDGEDLEQLYQQMATAVLDDGPRAVVCKRPMCVGIEGLEGEAKGHGPIPPAIASAYLSVRGRAAARPRTER